METKEIVGIICLTIWAFVAYKTFPREDNSQWDLKWSIAVAPLCIIGIVLIFN